MTKTRTRTKGDATNRAPGRPITWTGIERPPAKRWWWFLAFGYVAFMTSILLVSLQQWTFAAALVIAAVATVVVYLGRPRTVRAKLTGDTLTVNGQLFQLTAFKHFRVDDEGAAMVLVPRRVVALRVEVPLSGDGAKDRRIIEALARRLELVPATTTIIDRLARWMRLG